MRKMKDSGVEWIGEIPEDWKLERLQWHIREIVEKNNPVITTQVLSLTNKKGVIPYEEKGAQGNTSKENYDEYKIAYPDTIVANSMNILIGSVGYCNYYGCVSPVYYVYKEIEGNALRFVNYIMQIDDILNGVNSYLKRLARKQIELAFQSVQQEIDYLHKRTSEGVRKAQADGKRVGTELGRRLTTKKSVAAKAVILKWSRDFGGTMTDVECMRQAGVSRNSYYKYKKELIAGDQQ